MNKRTPLALLAFSLAGLLAATAADAASIRVKCEQRGTRSATVSVDGSNMTPGAYSALVISGSNSAQSGAMDTVGDEVAFDFSSKPNDIAAGAVEIPRNFIQGGSVTAKILSGDFTVISDTVACRVR